MSKGHKHGSLTLSINSSRGEQYQLLDDSTMLRAGLDPAAVAEAYISPHYTTMCAFEDYYTLNLETLHEAYIRSSIVLSMGRRDTAQTRQVLVRRCHVHANNPMVLVDITTQRICFRFRYSYGTRLDTEPASPLVRNSMSAVGSRSNDEGDLGSVSRRLPLLEC